MHENLDEQLEEEIQCHVYLVIFELIQMRNLKAAYSVTMNIFRKIFFSF